MDDKEMPITNGIRLIRESIERVENVATSTGGSDFYECYVVKTDLSKAVEIFEAVELAIRNNKR